MRSLKLQLTSFNANADLVSEGAFIALNWQIKELLTCLTNAQTLRDDPVIRFIQMSVAAAYDGVISMQQAANRLALKRLAANLQENANAAHQAAFDTRFDQVIDRAIIERARATDQIHTFKETISLQENRIIRKSEDLIALKQLQPEAEASRLVYEFFLGRLIEINVQQGILQADRSVISLAVVPIGASSPHKSMILALSVILDDVLVLARESSKNTFLESTEHEKYTGYTVIDHIPSISAYRRRRIMK